ncbi:hypothetical protein LDG_7581 [Legionella drancourtii LLAP12]|uniref:Pesticin C-terminal domain-containing protein n=1 Tax=Legionella drancourtii LLAP12 TaxID=658187 RepID=G9EQN3_9GAMM|nr:hypothetical protein LDG_7581 [Legionella drancourtii LLAP12]
MEHVIYNDSERFDGKEMLAAEVSPLRTQSLNLNEKNDFFFYGSELSEYVGNVIDNDSEKLNGKGMFALNLVPLKPNDEAINVFSDIKNVWAKLNSKYGTKIIFSELSMNEGGQITHGYLPENGGKVLGRSGITFATGFDVGQRNEREIKNFNFPKALEEKLLPFAEKIRDDAKKLLPLALKTHLTAEEANRVDLAVKGEHLGYTIKSWNARRLKNTPLFNDLTSAQQTVLLSRTFHQGRGMPDDPVSKNFYSSALKNNWIEAEKHLRNYKVKERFYVNRVHDEADLLRRGREG